MSIKTIDTRGLSCPMPALMVMREIKSQNFEFEVLLDSECSSENITRLLDKYELKKEEVKKDDYTVFRISK